MEMKGIGPGRGGAHLLDYLNCKRYAIYEVYDQCSLVFISFHLRESYSIDMFFLDGILFHVSLKEFKTK